MEQTQETGKSKGQLNIVGKCFVREWKGKVASQVLVKLSDRLGGSQAFQGSREKRRKKKVLQSCFKLHSIFIRVWLHLFCFSMSSRFSIQAFTRCLFLIVFLGLCRWILNKGWNFQMISFLIKGGLFLITFYLQTVLSACFHNEEKYSHSLLKYLLVL